VFWSWEKDAAECHWGGKGETITITALVPMTAIDYAATAWKNMNPSLGRAEKEIQILEGKPITITKVEKGDEVIFSKKNAYQSDLVKSSSQSNLHSSKCKIALKVLPSGQSPSWATRKSL